MQLTDKGSSEQFTVLPNLPENRVTLCAAANSSAGVIQSLVSLGIEVITPKPSEVLPKSTASHADMLMLHTGGSTVIVESTEKELIADLRAHGFTVTESRKSFEGSYPGDVILNHLLCGRYMFGRIASADSTALEYARENGLTCVNVHQGYAKCSAMAVDSTSIISDDDTICTNAAKQGFDVLKIEKGDILLSGADYGFIGGCCGKLSGDIIAFTGKLVYHHSCDRILSFMRNRGVYPEYLTNGKLTDIGGILPLKEAKQ